MVLYIYTIGGNMSYYFGLNAQKLKVTHFKITISESIFLNDKISNN